MQRDAYIVIEETGLSTTQLFVTAVHALIGWLWCLRSSHTSNTKITISVSAIR